MTLVTMTIPVMAACWLTLISSSPSEMCLTAASVSTLLLLGLLGLVLESSEELQEVSGLGSGPGPSPGGEGQEGGIAREESAALWSPDDRLQEEKDSTSERRACGGKYNIPIFPIMHHLPRRVCSYTGCVCVSRCSSCVSSTNGSSKSSEVILGRA